MPKKVKNSKAKKKVHRAVRKIKRAIHKKIKTSAKKVSVAQKKYKSIVTEFLQKHKIPFEVQPHEKGVWSAEDISRERKVPLSQIVKCLVLTDGSNHVVACVPGNKKVKAGLVKQLLGTGKLEFMQEKHLKKMTGHPLGTTSPVGLANKIPVVIDKHLAKLKHVSISSGNKKFGLKVAAKDLVRLSNGQVAKISD